MISGSGAAGLHVGMVRKQSTVLCSWARSPMALLTPRARGHSVWAYSSSYGGGLVAGDEMRLELRVDAGACCFLSTQASTKVYRNPQGRPCSFVLDAELASRSLLVLAPDPVQCFAEATYRQEQSFRLADDANLVLVDWLSAGRSARGERWAFDRFASTNRVSRSGKLIFLDSVLLERGEHQIAAAFRTGRFNCLAMVALFGPMLSSWTQVILGNISERPVKRRADLIVSASAVAEGLVLRFAGLSVEQVGYAMHEQLSFIPELLQGDPLRRKW
jgi:urease accessory protein